MSTEERNFIVFNVKELCKVNFSQVLETSEETVRRSVDGTKTFVKWEGSAIPSFLESLTTKEGPYSYEEMLQLLSTEEWNTPMTFSNYNPISQQEEL